MHQILFVCHGNICRSPMAEFIMRKLVADAGRTAEFTVASRATSAEELGNPPYPPARRKLAQMGIPLEPPHRATRLVREDYGQYDMLIGMDSMNVRNMERICGGDPEGKIRLLREFSGEGGDIADPWYTGDFDVTYDQILAGCRGLLASLP